MSLSEDEVDPFSRLDLVAMNTPPEYGAVGETTFDLLDSPVQLAQDLSRGCGGKIWEAANVLVDYCLWKDKTMAGEFLNNKRVLELGSGTGLVGLAIAKGCPQLDTMVITDQM